MKKQTKIQSKPKSKPQTKLPYLVAVRSSCATQIFAFPNANARAQIVKDCKASGFDYQFAFAKDESQC